MSTDLSRKKKLRGAHRASATRLQKTVSEVLISFDPNNLEEIVPKLNQLKTSMKEKLETLKVLDEEILELVDEANIEEEIEQCDICREGLQLALENVERALNTSSMPSLAVLSNVTENTTSNTPPVPSQAPTSPQGSSASTASTSLLQNQYSSQLDTSNENGMPNLGQPSMSTVNQPQPVEHPTIPPASPDNPGGHPAVQPINRVAQSFMDGAAAESIAGLSLTNANYEEAFVILKSSYQQIYSWLLAEWLRKTNGICKGKKPSPPPPRDPPEEHGQSGSNKSKESTSLGTHPDATVCHTTSSNCVLLQTARANIHVYNPDNPDSPKVKARLILDGGSQCSYVSSALTGTLGLQSKSQRSVNIKIFGSSETNAQVIDVVNLGIETAYGANIEMLAFTVPLICQPLKNQFVSSASKTYPHLANLHLADYSFGQHDAKVDILIGSDHYWKIVTGKTRQGESGPTTIQTRLGWVLSGPVGNEPRQLTHTSNLATIHTLKCASEEVECKNDVVVQELKRFWDLETLGIQPQCVYKELLESIKYENNHCVFNLPWKPDLAELPDNYDLSKKRLLELLKRL
ncbi:Hypothetical predicted protein, partial [Paramuricea clavata]